MDKTAKQITHEQRNAARKAEAAAAKAARMEAHSQHNLDLATQAAVRRDARTAANEETALASATDAYAQAIEQRYGISANDNMELSAAA